MQAHGGGISEHFDLHRDGEYLGRYYVVRQDYLENVFGRVPGVKLTAPQAERLKKCVQGALERSPPSATVHCNPVDYHSYWETLAREEWFLGRELVIDGTVLPNHVDVRVPSDGEEAKE